jgi:class 3 adenylate cyclase
MSAYDAVHCPKPTAASAADSPEPPADETRRPAAPPQPPQASSLGRQASPSGQAGVGPWSLSPQQIDPPAFFVDRDLTLRWIAPSADDPLSQALSAALTSSATGPVFDLLLRPSIKSTVCDWQRFFSFVYTLLRPFSAPETEATRPAAPADGAVAPGPIPASFGVASCLLATDPKENLGPLRIFGLEFREGILFLLRRDHWQDSAATAVEREPAAVGTDFAAERKTIGVLSLRLHHAHHLAEIMLPDLFFQLTRRIRDVIDGVAKPLGGVRSGGDGDRIHYLFSESAGRNPIFSAISCANRINGHLAALEEQLKTDQGWLGQIRMNMGISCGTDDPAKPHAGSSMELWIPGGALDQAVHLSAMATNGETWITKDAVARLPQKLINQIVLGVDRQGRFLRNFFSRLSDLQPDTAVSGVISEIGRLSVARIVEIERPTP